MKTAVYSCIVNGYDEPRAPLFFEENCDYFMVSDDPKMAGPDVRWIDVNSVVPDIEMSPKEKNRYCKFHPDILFPDYDYSIYLDGCIQVAGPVSRYVSDVGVSGIALHRHRRSTCIYKEGILLIWLGVVDKDKMVGSLKRYAIEGFPRNYSMFECGMIVTDLNNVRARDLYSKWYDEYMNGIGRDQQDLMYVLWKNGLKDDIGIISGGKYNIYSNPGIIWHRKSHYS